MDLLYSVLIVALVGVSFLLIRGCERLRRPS
jgi:hypothetical protein